MNSNRLGYRISERCWRNVKKRYRLSIEESRSYRVDCIGRGCWISSWPVISISRDNNRIRMRLRITSSNRSFSPSSSIRLVSTRSSSRWSIINRWCRRRSNKIRPSYSSRRFHLRCIIKCEYSIFYVSFSGHGHFVSSRTKNTDFISCFCILLDFFLTN